MERGTQNHVCLNMNIRSTFCYGRKDISTLKQFKASFRCKINLMFRGVAGTLCSHSIECLMIWKSIDDFLLLHAFPSNELGDIEWFIERGKSYFKIIFFRQDFFTLSNRGQNIKYHYSIQRIIHLYKMDLLF